LILDSSAILAVLFEGEGNERLVGALEGADVVGIGAPTLIETGIVAVKVFDLHGRSLVAQFLERWNVVVVPFGDRHERAALDAFIRYGKGRHPARLNLGDCMSYATASIAGEPLLFVGNDFAQTDLTPALA
jgi:ribonuclease VapC